MNMVKKEANIFIVDTKVLYHCTMYSLKKVVNTPTNSARNYRIIKLLVINVLKLSLFLNDAFNICFWSHLHIKTNQ